MRQIYRLIDLGGTSCQSQSCLELRRAGDLQLHVCLRGHVGRSMGFLRVLALNPRANTASRKSTTLPGLLTVSVLCWAAAGGG